MCIVVLEESVGAAIEDLYFSIGAARGEAGAVGVEAHLVDHSGVIGKHLNLSANIAIPKAYCSVVTARSNHTGIMRENCRFYPVLMT